MLQTISPDDSAAPWRAALSPYARPTLSRSALGLATSVVPYLALSALMYAALGVSYALTLVLAIPTAGFLSRTFIMFHDCAHGAFMATKRANTLLGTALGLLVFSDFRTWKHNHAMHHASAGDLDRRGAGDVPTMTVTEYQARSWRGRLAYRLFRNPLVMFYVQHQFEDAYWESSERWSYADAALRGSSYLKLPRVLRFFSGNIGLHHVHHLSARIPNYNLQRAHDDNPIFHGVPVISLADGLRAVRLKLYDERQGRMVTFAQAQATAARRVPAP